MLLYGVMGAMSPVVDFELSLDGGPPSQNLCDAVSLSVAVSRCQFTVRGGASVQPTVLLAIRKSGLRQRPPPLSRAGSGIMP